MTGLDYSRPFDHGEQNIPMAKRVRGGWDGMDSQLRRHVAAQERERRRANRAAAQERYAARKVERAAEAARVKLTAADIRGHVAVRTVDGWFRIVRVNSRTVTVETPYSWTDRIPFDKVLEARS